MRKRSKYKPKGVRLDNLSWIKAGFAKVGTLPKAGIDLKLKNHEALDSLMRGQGTRDHVDALIAAFNIAEALYKVNPNLGLDYAEEIKYSQNAILTMSRRGLEKGRFLFSGPEMQTIRHGMEIHDAQLDAANVRDMEKAIDLVTKVILNKQARVIQEKTCEQLTIRSTTQSRLNLKKQKKKSTIYATNGELTEQRSWAGQSAIMEAIEKAQDDQENESGHTERIWY